MSFLPCLSLLVEKVDSPIGDENICILSERVKLFGRESRFPDRGRKPSKVYYPDSIFTGRESRFPDRGRKLLVARPAFQLFRVEKVDSPIGDENNRARNRKTILLIRSRESRFPDRGRKPNSGSLFTYSSRNVEKVDSPIGDENGSTNLSPSAFITYKKRRCSDRGREFPIGFCCLPRHWFW